MAKTGLLQRCTTPRAAKILALAAIIGGMAVAIGFRPWRHAHAVLSIRQIGADVKDCEPATRWPSTGILSGIYHPPVCSVSYWGDVGPNQLAPLEYLPEIKELDASGDHVTDLAMRRLRPLCNLEMLTLERTGITDQGLSNLDCLAQLRTLNLFYTSITDAGLGHLRMLPNLRELRLGRTKISDAGLKVLSELTQLQILDVSEDPQVTNAGLEYLYSLKSLTDINVFATGVTTAGVRKFRMAVPNCRVFEGIPLVPIEKPIRAEPLPSAENGGANHRHEASRFECQPAAAQRAQDGFTCHSLAPGGAIPRPFAVRGFSRPSGGRAIA